MRNGIAGEAIERTRPRSRAESISPAGEGGLTLHQLPQGFAAAPPRAARLALAANPRVRAIDDGAPGGTAAAATLAAAGRGRAPRSLVCNLLSMTAESASSRRLNPPGCYQPSIELCPL